jgi:hypothetical protein
MRGGISSCGGSETTGSIINAGEKRLMWGERLMRGVLKPVHMSLFAFFTAIGG